MKYWLCGFISIGLWAAEPAGEAAKKPAEAQPYLRFEEKAKGAALEVGVIRMQHKETGALVDLVGAVHIGDAAYYQQLNKEFKTYEAVLYEMVKPAKLDPAQFKNRPSSSVSMMQIFMQKQLDLAYQLDEVDYTAKNFVHADMTMETFQERQKAKGQNLFSLIEKSIEAQEKAGSENKQQFDFASMFKLLNDEGGPNGMKLALGRQFHDIESMIGGMEGPDGSVLVAERNITALKVMESEMKKGKKNLGIFYGAAHLPDFDKRLIEDYGFKRTTKTWNAAWKIQKAAAKKALKDSI